MSKEKKAAVLEVYKQLESNAQRCKAKEGNAQYEALMAKMRGMRIALTCLGVHIGGINGRDRQEQHVLDESYNSLLGRDVLLVCSK